MNSSESHEMDHQALLNSAMDEMRWQRSNLLKYDAPNLCGGGMIGVRADYSDTWKFYSDGSPVVANFLEISESGHWITLLAIEPPHRRCSCSTSWMKRRSSPPFVGKVGDEPEW
jgi:hypothetical protein